MSRGRTALYFVVIAIVAAAAGAFLAHALLHSGANSTTLQSGTFIEPPRSIPHFTLVDQDGNPFDNTTLSGQWSILFFGFTNCGDVCPTTLALLANVEKTLVDASAKSRLRVIFISVDYKRDTPASVRAYVKSFNPAFVGLTGTQEEIERLTTALGVPSAVRQLDNGGYAVDHSAVILAVDPEGKLRAVFSPPHTLEALGGDFKSLIGSS